MTNRQLVKKSFAVGGAVALLAALLVSLASALPTAAAGGPRVSIGDTQVLERDSTHSAAYVPITLSEPAASDVTVSYYTTSGSATAGTDYYPNGSATNPRMVTIPAGSVQSYGYGYVLPDDVEETPESFFIAVSSVTGGDATVGAKSTGSVLIHDSDSEAGPSPLLYVTRPQIVEGDSGTRTVQFQIQLSRPSGGVAISYQTLDGSADGDDYKAKLPGTVMFAPGQITKSIDVQVSSDTDFESDENLILQTTVVGGATVEELGFTGDTGVVYIVNDDPAPVPCEPGSFSVLDGNEPCTPAPPGTYVDTGMATSATPCEPGSYQDEAGQTECKLAPIGSYVDTSGSTTFTPCPGNTTTASEGATSPDDCVALGATQVAAGGDHSCAVMADGTVRCWGRNSPFGQLGDGTTTSSNVPVTVAGLSGVTQVVGAQYGNCALLDDGTVKCWGDNRYGQLGDGTNIDSATPVTVSGLSGVTQLAAHSWTICALLDDGTARCWGYNNVGQLGNGTTTDSNVPVSVSGLSGATQVSVGGAHACALVSDATARCWGFNIGGALGDGTTTASSVPVTVAGLSGAEQVSAGLGFTCALLADTTATCWGGNFYGTLGDGTTTDRLLPSTAVSGLVGATQLSSAGFNACGRLSGGTVKCWGSNIGGQIGDGTTGGQANSPTSVLSLESAVQVSMGMDSHACAVLVGQTVACWGTNGSGQLGNGSASQSDVPVFVTGIGDPPEPPTPCSPGSFNATDGNEPCTAAPTGSFVDTSGATAATECVAGEYQDLEGQTSCTPAPAGSFVDTSGATAATECVAGEYQDLEGQTSCKSAPIGSYVDTPGATAPTPCPHGMTTTFQGATSAGDCVATVGLETAVVTVDGGLQLIGFQSPFTYLQSQVDLNLTVTSTNTGVSSGTMTAVVPGPFDLLVAPYVFVGSTTITWNDGSTSAATFEVNVASVGQPGGTTLLLSIDSGRFAALSGDPFPVGSGASYPTGTSGTMTPTNNPPTDPLLATLVFDGPMVLGG